MLHKELALRVKIGGFLKSVFTGEAPQVTPEESKKIKMTNVAAPMKQASS